MAEVLRAWVDSPLITIEKRIPRSGFIWPWQSKLKGIVCIHEGFQAFGLLDNGCTIRCQIPKGFQTDFYSIPAFARPLIPKSQVGWNQAAVVHDRLYLRNVVQVFDPAVGDWSPDSLITRHTADQMLYALMDDFEAPPIRHEVIYSAVRVGGGGTWEYYRSHTPWREHLYGHV